MMELAKSLKILSIAGALMLAVPVAASARDGGGHGGGGHPGGGHGDHHGRYGGGDDFFATFDDGYPGDYAYANDCTYYNGKWHQTGSPYWLRRYEGCMRG